MLRRLYLTIWAVLCLFAAPAWAQPAPPPTVRIVATRFTMPAKFDLLAAWAREAGYRLEWRQVEQGGSRETLLQGADLLVFDGPRPSDMAAIDEAVGGIGDTLAGRWIAVGGGPPRSGGINPVAARRLIGWYGGGGEANLRSFVQAVPLVLRGGDIATLPAPVPLGKAGLYHPGAGGLFADATDFARWAAETGRAGRPVVGIAMSDGLIRDMQTGVIDAVVAAIEAKGLLAAPFWYDEADPRALTKVAAPLKAIAIVNATHMQNADARRAEFAALDIPVLQVVNDRTATPDQWRANPTGISLQAATISLSVPEGWGIADPIVVGAMDGGRAVPLPEQVELLAGKLARLAALRATPAADKRVALFFWNYPAGEKNLAASNLNLPRSIVNVSAAMARAGYRTEPQQEGRFIGDAQAMLGGFYRPETLAGLEARGLAARVPLGVYRAWFDTLPATARDAVVARWGRPEDSPWLRNGAFVVPRLQSGNLAILPQPPRGGDPAKSYHDQKTPPDHLYLAAYLWVRGHADAIVHFGTHGTQEWTPGKDRGLAAGDWPFLLVGDLPVFYPYIQDNVAEAIQARRRGRAVTISHQTPAFGPSGLYDELRDIHALIHEYAQLDEGGVRDRVAADIRAKAVAAGLARDIGWDGPHAAADFPAFYAALHDHLHEVARQTIPLGLHSFGEPATPEHRLATVMQQLGPDYLKALGIDPVEAFAGDFKDIAQSREYRTLATYLRDGGDPATISNAALRAQIERAIGLDRRLAQTGENEALLSGLAGGFVLPGQGGDPVRNPEVESGRNLYAFEAEKVPTRAAYQQGGAMLDRLIEAYRASHGGKAPAKLAFVMFSGETIRQMGVVEGQILHALGLRPVWGRGDRLEGLEVIPAAELGRPRIDVVVQASSVYRDQFDGFMRQLARGIDRIAELGEAVGPAANARKLAARLVERGMNAEQAVAMSRLRIFSNAPGDYGSGLPDQIARAKDWRDDADLADPFLARLQYAYGARDWGVAAKGENLFAEQLRGVDAAVLSRSSNVHGLLSTDHPFEYLGGISLAVRSLTGRTPDLYVADMRGGDGKVTTAGAFLSNELRGRYLNPQWIGAMQAEGYAGANAMLGIVNNLWGWQVTDPASVRADQWQAVYDTYVRDSRNLGLNRFFARVHPSAQRQIVERMQEAVARGYWQADGATRASLDALRARLARADAAAPAAQGFGTAPAPPVAAGARPAPVAATASPPSAATVPPQPPAPEGMVLKRVTPPAPAAAPRVAGVIPMLMGLLLLFGIGAARQWLAGRESRPRLLPAYA